ncbi:AAA family ATPase [Skermania sp. ID1734]|uniref:AAA family ATPase n=1 Tax=Skermania sp. ID1734 TaxID=2597516 RepID=UPI00117FEF46|nr:AAA family ATPase [Skermania sp. ID1734]TSE00572.1 AAA family ATPase [Skermania sp. ID1734]
MTSLPIGAASADLWAAAPSGIDKDTIRSLIGGPKAWRATELAASAPIEWLATNRLPCAAITYLVGSEGIGKSLFVTWLTALITTGKPFAGFGIPARQPQGAVLVLTEDDWVSTARPRLEAAGADLEFIRVICEEKDGTGSPTFPKHLDVVKDAVAEGAALVAVDAWSDTLPSTLSVRDPQQARQALHPWKDLASSTGVAVLLCGHLNRDASGNVRNAYGMSGEIRKKVRFTLLAQPDPDDESALLIGPEKTNLAGKIAASKFKIGTVQRFTPTAESDGTVPVLEWVGDAATTARQTFAEAAEAAQESGGSSGAAAALDEAKIWLADELEDGGEHDSAELKAAAKDAGIAERTLQRARHDMGVSVVARGRRSFWQASTHANTEPVSKNLGTGGTGGTGQETAGQDTNELCQDSICATRANAQDIRYARGTNGTDSDLCPVCRHPLGLLAAAKGVHPDCSRKSELALVRVDGQAAA